MAETEEKRKLFRRVTIGPAEKLRTASQVISQLDLASIAAHLPQFAVITDGQTSAIQSVRQLQFARGTVVVIDRGYQDFGWWLELSRRKFLFVTQLKDNAEYGIVQQRRADPERDIQRDEVVVLTKLQAKVLRSCRYLTTSMAINAVQI